MSQDAVPAYVRRNRMRLALRQLPFAGTEHAALLPSWLKEQPEPEHAHEEDPAELEVSVAFGLQAMTWWAGGDPALFGPRVDGLLAEGGGDPAEIERVAAARERLEPQIEGSWLAATADELLGGWYFPGSMALGVARGYADQTPANQRLGDWARRCGATTCILLRRAVGETPWTELVVALTGEVAQQLDLAQAAMKAMGSPALPDAVVQPLGAAAGLALSVRLDEGGLRRVGVLADGCAQGSIDALVGAVEPNDPAGLAAVREALGGIDPEFVGVYQAPTGVVAEIYYAP